MLQLIRSDWQNWVPHLEYCQENMGLTALEMRGVYVYTTGMCDVMQNGVWGPEQM